MAIVGDINRPGAIPKLEHSTMREGSNVLTMNDFLKLMAVQMSNQDMSNPMSESEFMNQMVQMATVQAMTTFTDVATTTYAASLVGKQVTVGELTKDGMKEIVGTVTGAGLYAGEQIIFVDGKSYSLTSIMAIGVLPPKEEDPEKPTDPPNTGDGEKPTVPPATGDGEKPTDPPATGDGEKPTDPPATGDGVKPTDPPATGDGENNTDNKNDKV